MDAEVNRRIAEAQLDGAREREKGLKEPAAESQKKLEETQLLSAQVEEMEQELKKTKQREHVKCERRSLLISA